MNNYRRAKLLSAQTKMVRQIMGLQWWKSSAKWEAEQMLEECTDYSTPQSSIYKGCTELQNHIEDYIQMSKAHKEYCAAKELQPTGRNGPTGRKSCSKHCLSTTRPHHKTKKSPSATTTQHDGSSDITSSYSIHTQHDNDSSSQSTSSSNSLSKSSDEPKDTQSKQIIRCE